MTDLAAQFDADFLHNFGPEEVIPEGAVALCGAISTREGIGQPEPLRIQCCPICVALTEQEPEIPG